MPVKVGQRKFNHGDATALKQRQVCLFFPIPIVQRNPGEVGNNNVAGNLFGAAIERQVLIVAESLRFGLDQTLAERPVFHQNDTRLESNNQVVLPANVFTSSSNVAIWRRMPKTVNNSSQKDFPSASSHVSPPFVREANGIAPAKVTTVLTTKALPTIRRGKLDGLALLAPVKIAQANDHDSGIGENPDGGPSRI